MASLISIFGQGLQKMRPLSRLLLLLLVTLTTITSAQEQDSAIAVVKWNPVNDVLAVNSGNSVWLATPALQEIAQLEPLAQSGVEFTVQQIEWSPDGHKLAIGILGDFNTDPTSFGTQIWDVASVERLVTINGIGVRGFAWSPDSNRIAGGCAELGGDTCVYNALDGTLLGQLVPSRSYGIAWSSDGSQIAVNSGRFIQVRNATTYELIATLTDEMNSDTAPVFSPNENLLAFISSGDSRIIYVWDTETMQRVQTLQGHTERLSRLDWGTGGLVSVTTSPNGTVRIWDVATGQATTIINTEPVITSWSPDGTLLAMSNDGNVEMRDPLTGNVVRSMPPYIDSLSLVDADTGDILTPLNNGAIVDLADFNAANFAIEASTVPGTVGSVIFELNSVVTIDNTAPYLTTVTSGTYALTVRSFPSADGQGVPGGEYSLSFTLISDNQPPTANAGRDQTLTDTDSSGSELVTLDGSGSNDPDGTITSYSWTENGVEIATGVSPQVDLAVGVHVITLTVTDDDGATDTDDVTITVNPPGTGGRVTDDLVVLYTFEEGSGSTVNDVSGVGTPLNLTIQNPANVTWGDHSVKVDAATLISSGVAATKINNAVIASNEITVEAWIVPGNLTQEGPARIVTLSPNQNYRNVTLGQGIGVNDPTAYEVRLRTTQPAVSGKDYSELDTPTSTVTLDLQHVVFTRDAAGVTTLYVDGSPVATGSALGDMSNWDTNYQLGLANEFTNNRPRLGTFHHLAIYDRAISSAEVTQHFNDGPEGQSLLVVVPDSSGDAIIETVQPRTTILDADYWLTADRWTPDARLDEVWFVSILDRPANKALELKQSLRIGETVGSQMTFWYKGYTTSADTVMVEVMVEGRRNWQAIHELNSLETDWVQQVVDLSAYQGQNIRVRFRLNTRRAVPAGEGGIGFWMSEPRFEQLTSSR